MIYDAVARHKSGRVLAIKSIRRSIGNKVAKVASGEKGSKTLGEEGNFPP